MILDQENSFKDSRVPVLNFLPKIGKDSLRREIIAGLTSHKKHISSKFFYDAVGSKLFEEITRLPEYYLTRTEKSILQEVAHNTASKMKDLDIIELGSGDYSKISILFKAMPSECIESVKYIPVDVSQSAIKKSANTLLNKFPALKIQGIVADFTRQLKLIPTRTKRLFCFFGSTIGNFSQEKATQFMNNLSEVMHSGSGLLLGVDMVKNREILERAYNDSRNVTQAFNRNILNVVNSLIGTDLKPQDFEHVAFYNQEHPRIEMHLKAKKDIEISCAYLPKKIIMRKGETIHTENSYKYTNHSINKLASASGLEIKNRFTDKNNWFSVIQLYKKEENSP